MKNFALNFWLSILFFIGVSALRVYGQDSINVGNKGEEGYKSWSKPRFALRTGLGFQKSFYGELGVSRHTYFYNDLGFASAASYIAVEVVPAFRTSQKVITGLKAGYEINGRTLALGIESKLLTDSDTFKGIITPKVGIGMLGVINVFYGYNIWLHKNPFERIGNHQFSINGNFNRNLLQQLRWLK